MEKLPTVLTAYKIERYHSVKREIDKKINLFLEVNAIPGTKIVWEKSSTIFTLRFTLIETDDQEVLLTGDTLHVDLIRYLTQEPLPGFEEYVLNPFEKPGFISFIKESQYATNINYRTFTQKRRGGYYRWLGRCCS
jgi:hypothetical protein